MFGYATIPDHLGNNVSKVILGVISVLLMWISTVIISKEGIHNIMNLYFAGGLLVLVFTIYLLLNPYKKSNFLVLNILRIWVFVGIIAMLMDGIILRF